MPCTLGCALVVLLPAGLSAQGQTNTQPHWVGTWASSQQIPEPRNTLPFADLHDATMRQIFHVSIGGSVLRVRLSNAFGVEPLRFTSVHIARPVSATVGDTRAAIDPATDRALTFGGKPDLIVPAGAEYWSDPIAWDLPPQSSITLSFHLSDAPAVETSHPGSRETTWYLDGDHTASADMPGALTVEHWFQVSGIDVEAAPQASAIVALGDSITDGHATTTNGNDRWTDVLAERLLADPTTKNLSVLNEGTGGNRLLNDGLGPNALARFDRDVLAQSRARYLIVFEGVNDLGTLRGFGQPPTPADHAALVARMEGAYQQMIDRAHTHGLEAIGATITPFGGSGYAKAGPALEQDREAINAWIRAPGHFDAVIDFDAALRDPRQPDRMLPSLDCGDHLHPSPAGYRKMAESIPLNLFSR
ncbi:MAG TPA: SGNH/GDSL hydrolase family protein [Acidobacteriaceae bacterium]|nr:SGNH/GDSL hydrolase family protein [Acidobacteriaceae bacterium]